MDEVMREGSPLNGESGEIQHGLTWFHMLRQHRHHLPVCFSIVVKSPFLLILHWKTTTTL